MKTEITITLKHRKEINSLQWDDFISESGQHIIYAKSFYLDAVHPEWMALYCWNKSDLLAVMPICSKNKFLLTCIIKPCWTQYLGIFFKKEEDKLHRYYYLQKLIITSIIKNFPKPCHFFNYNFIPSFEYYLPFYWSHYKITPYQSYELDIQKDIKDIYDNFSSSATNSIKRANKLHLQIVESKSIVELSDIMFARKIINEKERTVLHKLWDNLLTNNCCFSLYIKDLEHNHIYCGGAFIIDQDRLIFLASALDFKFKKSGAASLLVWSAIQKAKQLTHIRYFDFEGSMLENIENYFRTFGAKTVLYYNIQKAVFPFNVLKNMKDIINKKRIKK